MTSSSYYEWEWEINWMHLSKGFAIHFPLDECKYLLNSKCSPYCGAQHISAQALLFVSDIITEKYAKIHNREENYFCIFCWLCNKFEPIVHRRNDIKSQTKYCPRMHLHSPSLWWRKQGERSLGDIEMFFRKYWFARLHLPALKYK